MRTPTGSDVIEALSKSQFRTSKHNRVPDRQIAYCSGLNSSETDRFLEQIAQQVNHPTPLADDCLKPMVREVRVMLFTLQESQQVEQFLQDHQFKLDIADIFGRPYLRGFCPTTLRLNLWTAVQRLPSPQSVAALNLS